MKVLALVFILIISISGFSQNYTEYLKQGKNYFAKEQYMTALERFDLAYEFAKTDPEKEESLNWKNRSREKLKKFQDDLQNKLDSIRRLNKSKDSLQEVTKKLHERTIEEKENAENERTKADNLRKAAIARSLAFLSIKIHQDNLKSKTLTEEQAKLPLIMAYQAWYFNNVYKGNRNDPDIYAALSEVGDSSVHVRIKKNTDIVRDIVVSESGDLFASCSDRDSVKIFKFSDIKKPISMNIPKTDKIYYFRSLVFSPDEKWIVAGTYQGEILFWNIENKKPITLYEPSRYAIKSANKSINKLIAINKSNQLISAGSDGYIRYWNFNEFLKNDSKENKKSDSTIYLAEKEKFTTAVLNEDKSEFAVASETGKVRIFDSNTHKLIDSCSSEKGKILSLCWNNKNDLIIGYESGWIEIRNEKILKPFRVHDSGVTDIHFDNQNNRLITSSYDGKIKIWNFENLDSEPVLIKGHSDWVSSLALTKDNSMVVSGSADKSILITKINIDELKTIVRNKISKNMSLDNWNKYLGYDIPYNEELH